MARATTATPTRGPSARRPASCGRLHLAPTTKGNPPARRRRCQESETPTARRDGCRGSGTPMAPGAGCRLPEPTWSSTSRCSPLARRAPGSQQVTRNPAPRRPRRTGSGLHRAPKGHVVDCRCGSSIGNRRQTPRSEDLYRRTRRVACRRIRASPSAATGRAGLSVPPGRRATYRRSPGSGYLGSRRDGSRRAGRVRMGSARDSGVRMVIGPPQLGRTHAR